jgi:hypothetical protein
MPKEKQRWAIYREGSIWMKPSDFIQQKVGFMEDWKGVQGGKTFSLDKVKNEDKEKEDMCGKERCDTEQCRSKSLGSDANSTAGISQAGKLDDIQLDSNDAGACPSLAGAETSPAPFRRLERMMSWKNPKAKSPRNGVGSVVGPVELRRIAHRRNLTLEEHGLFRMSKRSLELNGEHGG